MTNISQYKLDKMLKDTTLTLAGLSCELQQCLNKKYQYTPAVVDTRVVLENNLIILKGNIYCAEFEEYKTYKCLIMPCKEEVSLRIQMIQNLRELYTTASELNTFTAIKQTCAQTIAILDSMIHDIPIMYPFAGVVLNESSHREHYEYGSILATKYESALKIIADRYYQKYHQYLHRRLRKREFWMYGISKKDEYPLVTRIEYRYDDVISYNEIRLDEITSIDAKHENLLNCMRNIHYAFSNEKHEEKMLDDDVVDNVIEIIDEIIKEMQNDTNL